MARKEKRELTISEYYEINWNDGMYSETYEREYMREFERGWQDLEDRLHSRGHTNLKFDPMSLVV